MRMDENDKLLAGTREAIDAAEVLQRKLAELGAEEDRSIRQQAALDREQQKRDRRAVERRQRDLGRAAERRVKSRTIYLT